MHHLVNGEKVHSSLGTSLSINSSVGTSLSIFSCILSIDDFANSPAKTAITTLTNTRATTNK